MTTNQEPKGAEKAAEIKQVIDKALEISEIDRLQGEADRLSVVIGRYEATADRIKKKTDAWRNELAIILAQLAGLGVEKPKAINDRFEKFIPFQSTKWAFNIPKDELEEAGVADHLGYQINKTILDNLKKQGLLTQEQIDEWAAAGYISQEKGALGVKKDKATKDEMREIAFRGL